MEVQLLNRWRQLIEEGKTPVQAEQTLLRQFARIYGAGTVLNFARKQRLPQESIKLKIINPIFEGCDKDDDGNVMDPISKEEIPEGLLLSFIENGKKYCFNISYLAEYSRRARPENPLTRQPLSEEVQMALQTYEEQERSLISNVVTSFTEELQIRHYKDEPLGELIINVYRVISDYMEYERSSIELLQSYIVLTTDDLEVNVNESLKLIVEARLNLRLVDQLDYYIKLHEFCAKRFSLQSFTEAAYAVIKLLLIDVPFIRSVRYLSKQNQGNSYFTGDREWYPSSINDYYKTARRLFGNTVVLVSRSKKPLPIPDDLFFEVTSFRQASRKREVQRVIQKSYFYAIHAAIRSENILLTKRLLQDYKLVSETNELPFVEAIIQKFYPQDACDILQGFHIPYNTKFPDFVIEQDGIACLYNLTEKLAVEEALQGRPSLIYNSRTQAIVIMITGNADLFERYRKTLNWDILYDEHSILPETIYNSLTEAQKIEYGFRTGIWSEDFDVDTLKSALINHILNKKPFSLSGFTIQLPLKDIEELLLFAAEYNALTVFQSILTNVRIDDEQFVQWICRLSRGRMSEKYKEVMIAQVFQVMHNDLADSFYHCLDPELIVAGYVARVQSFATSIPDPQFPINTLLTLANNTSLTEQAIKFGLVSNDKLVTIINTFSYYNRFLDRLTPRQLQEIKSNVFKQYIKEHDFHIDTLSIQNAIAQNQELQEFLTQHRER